MKKVDIEHVSKTKLFTDFFLAQNGTLLSPEQAEIVTGLLQDKGEKK